MAHCVHLSKTTLTVGDYVFGLYVGVHDISEITRF